MPYFAKKNGSLRVTDKEADKCPVEAMPTGAWLKHLNKQNDD